MTTLIERVLSVCDERPCDAALLWLATQPDEATALAAAPENWRIWLVRRTTSEAVRERLSTDVSEEVRRAVARHREVRR